MPHRVPVLRRSGGGRRRPGRKHPSPDGSTRARPLRRAPHIERRPRMRTIVIAAAAALGVALAGAREAHACGRAGGGDPVPPGPASGVLALAAPETGMTLCD